MALDFRETRTENGFVLLVMINWQQSWIMLVELTAIGGGS